MTPAHTKTVSPREHALRTLAQFLARHGPESREKSHGTEGSSDGQRRAKRPPPP